MFRTVLSRRAKRKTKNKHSLIDPTKDHILFDFTDMKILEKTE